MTALRNALGFAACLACAGAFWLLLAMVAP